MAKKIRCLLLTTKDNRRFFTWPDNYRQLIEFSKTFGADMSVVKAESTNLPILDLAELAPAICNPHYVPPACGEIEILKSISVEEICNLRLRPRKRKKSKKQSVYKTAKQIRQHIRRTFNKGSIVDLRSVANRFRDARLNLCTFGNHIRHVRDELAAQGAVIERTGVGQYRLIHS